METYICERCGQEVWNYTSHYHCGGCNSNDVTGSYGHHKAYHLINGKMVNTEFHHCDFKNKNCSIGFWVAPIGVVHTLEKC